ncbi:MAG: 5-formyltetrahydrofolate cyclo-ligase [Lachnospiraceae bacterium]|nr:5-formyltetrahydrofolate cyclo-ligase [Candidatus Colinaster equi]
MDEISVLRKEIINKRKQLSLEARLSMSDTIYEKVCQLSEYKNSDNVLVYADVNGEVATDKIILNALLQGKNVYAPVCLDNHSMDFYQIFAIDEMYPGKYGIREPLQIDNLVFSKSKITANTICIVPGVLFDNCGNRVGYGAGYYDRYFDRMKIKNRIAICYDFQIVDTIKCSPHDITMTKVICN